MNYLAHLYFSAQTPLAWAGSLMGDFLKGPIPSQLPDELKLHVRLHRRLDSYTCYSEPFQTSRKRLDPRFRYARGVLVDVFYDHLLACNWSRYSTIPLEDFSSQVYRGLEACFELLPTTLQQQLPHMMEHDWLSSYRQPDIVLKVLQRLEARLRYKIPLAEGFGELARCRTGLESDFSAFMSTATVVFASWRSAAELS